MKSFRSKPVGWRGESYRHYLAAKYGGTKRYLSRFKEVNVVSQVEPNVRRFVNAEGRKITFYDLPENYKMTPDDVAYTFDELNQGLMPDDIDVMTRRQYVAQEKASGRDIETMGRAAGLSRPFTPEDTSTKSYIHPISSKAYIFPDVVKENDYLKHALLHEQAHSVKLGGKMADVFGESFDPRTSITKYGEENPKEDFAESFASSIAPDIIRWKWNKREAQKEYKEFPRRKAWLQRNIPAMTAPSARELDEAQKTPKVLAAEAMAKSGIIREGYFKKKDSVKSKYQKAFPKLVKDFGGENPRVTERFARFRQLSPSEFVPGTFRTKYQGDTELIVGKLKSTGKYAVQSVLVKRNKYFAQKEVFKKGKIHTTREGPEVIAVANEVKLALRPYAVRVQVAGSIRRRKKDPTDVDIVVIPRSQKERKLRERVKALADKVEAEGDKKIRMKVKGVPVDIMFAERADWGAQVLTWTGGAGHNIGLRRIAQRKGLKLNEYGLYRGDTRIAGNSEREIYRKLGRPVFKQPWQRE